MKGTQWASRTIRAIAAHARKTGNAVTSAVLRYVAASTAAAMKTSAATGTSTMSEEGVYNAEAQPCGHKEALSMENIEVCPTCDTYTVRANKEEYAIRDITQELVAVQHFDTANVAYVALLDRALKDLRKFVKY